MNIIKKKNIINVVLLVLQNLPHTTFSLHQHIFLSFFYSGNFGSEKIGMALTDMLTLYC